MARRDPGHHCMASLLDVSKLLNDVPQLNASKMYMTPVTQIAHTNYSCRSRVLLTPLGVPATFVLAEYFAHDLMAVLVVQNVSVGLIFFLHRPIERTLWCEKDVDGLQGAIGGFWVECVDDWDPEEVEAGEQEIGTVLIRKKGRSELLDGT